MRWKTKLKNIKPLLLLGFLFSSPSFASERLVVLTPDVASVVAALGAGADVVGRDRSSRFPEIAHAPEVGFHRSLNLEPIARLRPTLVLGSAQAQPASLWTQFKQLSIRAEQISTREDGQDFAASVRKIGQILKREAAAEKIAQSWEKAMQPRAKNGLRYLFTYDGHLVAGKNTAADTLIRIAGGSNIATHEGFKPLNKEAWLRAMPDVVVLAAHQGAATGGVEGLMARPELQHTPAVKNKRVYALPAERLFRVDLSSPKTVEEIRGL